MIDTQGTNVKCLSSTWAEKSGSGWTHPTTSIATCGMTYNQWGNTKSLKVYRCEAYVKLNPLTTEFFPPRQHIYMHSAHTTFVGTPLPQHSLLSGQTWWGRHTWRDPSGNTVNDIHDSHKPSNRRSKVDVSRTFAQHFPWTRSDWWHTLHHQFACFLDALGGVYEYQGRRHGGGGGGGGGGQGGQVPQQKIFSS